MIQTLLVMRFDAQGEDLDKLSVINLPPPCIKSRQTEL